MKSTLQRRFCTAGLLIVALLGLGGPAGAQETTHSVLILHSYHPEFQWTAELHLALARALHHHEPDLEIYTTFMDSKRFPLDEVTPLMRDSLAMKFTHHRPDLILLTDNNALDFFVAHRQMLFANIPAVFCGVNNYDPALLHNQTGITGVAESIDLAGTIRLIRRLHPNVDTIAVVSDTVPTGRLHRKQLQAIAPDVPELSFVELAELTEEQLGEQLSQLDKQTAILHLSFFRDAAGKVYTQEESVRAVTDHTDLPVYSLWDWKLGTGVLGGVMISAEAQAEAAADLAWNVLGGADPDSLPVITESPNRPMFDYFELKRHGIPLRALPENSTILNQPYSVYQEHQRLIWTVLGALVLLSGLSLFLLATMVRRKRAESALRQQSELLETILENIPPFVFWKNTRGVYLGCNQNFADALGLPAAEELIGKTDEDLPLTQSATASLAMLDQDVVQTGLPILNMELPMVLADGREILTLTSKVPLRNDRGEVHGILVVCHDITERKQLEEQLRHSQKMEAIGRLAGGIAHDFNNILTAIQGSAELLRQSLQNEENLGLAKQILKASSRATDLTRQLLDFARKGRRQSVPLNVHRTIQDVVMLLERSIDRRIEIRTELQARQHWVCGDPSQIHNAILNLGVNARDAMSDGGVLTIGTEDYLVPENSTERPPEEGTPGDYVQISVTDTGSGIARELHDRVFEPFFTTKAQGKGTGLGLAGVYGCVKSHNGFVRLESETGQGTAVHMHLPTSPPPKDDPNQTRAGQLSPACGHGGVLIVDDEEMVRTFAQRAIESMGYTPYPASSGLEALELYRRHKDKIDLVLLDLVMPQMSGEEVFEALRNINPDIRAIISSGYSQSAIPQDLLDSGVVGLLNKPFSIEQLARILAEKIHASAPSDKGSSPGE